MQGCCLIGEGSQCDRRHLGAHHLRKSLVRRPLSSDVNIVMVYDTGRSVVRRERSTADQMTGSALALLESHPRLDGRAAYQEKFGVSKQPSADLAT